MQQLKCVSEVTNLAENIVKHEPANKNSMRSATNLNIKDLPSKSTMKRDKKIPYSTNPLRLGEMEVSNLLLTKDGKTIEKLLKSYSTSKTSRHQTIAALLDPGENEYGEKNNPLNMDIPVKDSESINRSILRNYLSILELGLIDDDN